LKYKILKITRIYFKIFNQNIIQKFKVARSAKSEEVKNRLVSKKTARFFSDISKTAHGFGMGHVLELPIKTACIGAWDLCLASCS
jgi:hypothetical protein